jgi:hypothetical protein
LVGFGTPGTPHLGFGTKIHLVFGDQSVTVKAMIFGEISW